MTNGIFDFTATRWASDRRRPHGDLIGPPEFQAGAYQQADSTGGGAASDDGARVTFHGLAVDP